MFTFDIDCYFSRFIDRDVRQLRQWERSQSANLPPFHKVNILIILMIVMILTNINTLIMVIILIMDSQ